MKILKSAVTVSVLICVLFTQSMAQPNGTISAEKASPSEAQPYYDQPSLPDSYADVRRKKIGQSVRYLNVNKLPSYLLLGLLNITSPDESYPTEAPKSKTFGLSLYRVEQTMSVHLNIEKTLGESVTIRLLNDRGEALYVESVGRMTRKYARPFNLEEMKDGSYTFEVSSGQEVIRRVIKLSITRPVEKPSWNIAL